MPAKDLHHDTVVRALIKAGWTITGEQISIILVERRLWIDIRANKEQSGLAILVEVKGFENTPSPIEYLASAAGKYILYLAALELVGSSIPLYMAVPEKAYHGILSEALSKEIVQKVGIRFIVFDTEHEEIIQWID